MDSRRVRGQFDVQEFKNKGTFLHVKFFGETSNNFL
jgi:hypothetical protein